jgi:crossover junction endodeoxyribonuclease RuvC
VWAGSVITPSDLDEPARLRRVGEAVRSAIEDHRPTTIAVERVSFNRNQVSALAVARATGVAIAAAADAGVPVVEYAPTEVKVAVTGVGNADKQQVRRALVRVHGVRDVPPQADAADAVAVALTHLATEGLRSATRAGAR